MRGIIIKIFAVLLGTIYSSVLLAQDIVFVLPKTFKVKTHRVLIKGVVMDFNITEIDITSVNLIDLVKKQEKLEKTRKKRKIKKHRKKNWLKTLDYETIPVKNGFFQKYMDIKEGINAVLVKPVGSEPNPKNTAMKVIVLEKESKKIKLLSPKTDQIARLKQISGKIIKKPYPKSVKITVEALESTIRKGEKTYSLNKLLEAEVPVKREKFNLPVSLKKLLSGGEIVIITISTDGIEITKTLF